MATNNEQESEEGKTSYETDIDLNQVQQENDSMRECIELGGTTQEQLQEFEKSVSSFRERPLKQYLNYDDIKTYQFVLFDLETTSVDREAEICQLSAVSGNTSKTYSTYVMPDGSFDVWASMVNNLTIENIDGERTLCKHSDPVHPAPLCLDLALESFATFLQDICRLDSPAAGKVVTVLLGHRSSTFDIPILLRNADASFANKLNEMNIYLGDSLPLIRSLIKRGHSPLQQPDGVYCKASQCSVYQHLFQQEMPNAHDAYSDALALKEILFSSKLALDVETIINGSQIHTVREAQADVHYLDYRSERFCTFVGTLYHPNDKQTPISRRMAEKMAGSGLSYNELCSLYSQFGSVGVVAVLSMPPSHPSQGKVRQRVTKNKRILGNILAHLKSNASNID